MWYCQKVFGELTHIMFVQAKLVDYVVMLTSSDKDTGIYVHMYIYTLFILEPFVLPSLWTTN